MEVAIFVKILMNAAWLTLVLRSIAVTLLGLSLVEYVQWKKHG